MVRAVVKHSYVKGRQGIAKARAHINYLQYRPGEDREKELRRFFDKERDDILGRHIKERLYEQDQRGATMHKLMLSPGINTVDREAYTREVMAAIERQKGLNLEWYAVEHNNTDHHHIHVVVMGKDLDGRNVTFDRTDHKRLREHGDRYLEREHQLDRYLDRELELLLKHPDRQREVEYKRQRGDREFERLMYGDDDDRRRKRDKDRDHREWLQLDRELHKAFESNRGAERHLTYKQFQREAGGRLSGFHESYQNREARDRWEQMALKNPELAAEVDRELGWLTELEKEQKLDRFGAGDLDYLLDGKDEHQRWYDRFMDKEDLRPGGSKTDKEPEREPEPGINPMDLFNQQRGKEDREPETGFGDRASETFERDRQSQEQQGDQDRDRDRDDRDRGDDFFGR